jgi:hypothetical protein
MDILVKSVDKLLKSSKKYRCEICDYNTSRKYDYDKHLLTVYHKKCSESVEKTSKLFHCKICDYYTSRLFNFDKHKITAKHIRNEKILLCSKKHRCDHCCYETDSIQHYKKHLSSIKHIKMSKLNTITNDNENMLTSNMIYMLIQGTEELKNIIVKQNEQIIELSNKNSNITNNNTINNNNNQRFNLNFFLNEQCKDAMNLSDFIETIDVSFKDLEYVGEHGYVNGITKIIMDNLNEIDIYKRPIHCTDIKREIIHIKNNNKWEKDTSDNSHMKRFIASIGKKNSNLVYPWQLENPEYEILDSPKYNQWLRLAMRSNEYSKEIKNHEAILRNICKNIYLDKKELQLCNI